MGKYNYIFISIKVTINFAFTMPSGMPYDNAR